MGAELIIDRSAEGYRFWKDEHTQDPKEWQRFGKRIRELTGGDDVDIVFEHPGRETFGASRVRRPTRRHDRHLRVDVSGFLHEYDNRYLWMNLKRIIGSHFANYREAWEANRLIAARPRSTRRCRAPTRSTRPARPRTTCTATCTRARSACCAWPPEEGLGVRDPELRAEHVDADQPVPRRLRCGRSRAVVSAASCTDASAGRSSAPAFLATSRA